MSATDELVLSDMESFRARSLKREMDRIGLSGLSEKQCFLFKDVIAKLTALSEEQLLAFKDKLAKLKSRMPIWRALQEPPTLKQKQEAISRLRRSLDAIIRFERSGDKADGAIRNALDGKPPPFLQSGRRLKNLSRAGSIGERHEGRMAAIWTSGSGSHMPRKSMRWSSSSTKRSPRP